MLDGQLLTRAPLAAIAAGQAMRVPLLIGTNADEGSLLGDDAKPQSVIQNLSAADLAQARSLYGSPARADVDFARLLFRDGYFASPARLVAAHDAPSYLYRFSYVMSLLQVRRPSATHGSEIPFVFESFTTPRLSDVDRRVQTMMHGCWVAFAKTGKPECPGAPAWPAYERASDQWMVLDSTPRVEKIPEGAVMDLLRATLDGGQRK